MWKTFAGRCIYQSPQGIRIFQNILFRWLKFDSEALQSVLNRYLPQKPELKYIKSLILAAQLQPDDCCMLGLGGGGVAHALSPFLRQSKLVIVEKNAEVIELAQSFFMLNRLKNIIITHEDASLFMSKNANKFQHLLVDLFTADTFPAECSTEEFFMHCKQNLKPGGILVINLANSREHLALFQLIQKQFLQATLVMPVSGKANLIVFAQNSDTINPFLTLLKENRRLKELYWTGTWGYVGKLKSKYSWI